MGYLINNIITLKKIPIFFSNQYNVNVLTFKIHKNLNTSLFIIDYKKTKIDEN